MEETTAVLEPPTQTPEERIGSMRDLFRDKKIHEAILKAPASSFVGDLADVDLWKGNQLRLPNPHPKTLDEWATTLEKLKAEAVAKKPVATPGPVQSYIRAREEIAFTVECTWTETGTVTRGAYRNCSSEVRVPVSVARDGEDAVRDYVNDHMYDNPDYGDTEEGDWLGESLDDTDDQDDDVTDKYEEWELEQQEEEEDPDDE